MFSQPLEYRMDFPGVNELFDPATTINCDSFIRGDPRALKRNGNRVGLSIAPAISMRDKASESRLVYLAEVLLRPPSGC
ncbi:hypothetical protein BO71DRAFT_396880 [Aspergillus ellipticus CBS 707.79]|uniref:Uncharacterized protein n=1 Tax=Aspergillus ellipticus CBS 707.79 TaxID=1448320 RepID=A0A319DRP7_9EURO|nr:hypothetical protein BO71DRAFT_396880 [Aspergillus ellipticus CBS 707.79]